MKLKTPALITLTFAAALLLTGCSSGLDAKVQDGIADDAPVTAVSSPSDGHVEIETSLEYGFGEALIAEQICNSVKGTEGLNSMSISANNGSAMVKLEGGECVAA